MKKIDELNSSKLRTTYQQQGYVPIPGLVDEAACQTMSRAVIDLLESGALLRVDSRGRRSVFDFWTINGAALEKHLPYAKDWYTAVRPLVADITNTDLEELQTER